MVAWAVKNFGGMIPRTGSRNLADNLAETAVNCDLNSGYLDGLPVPELVQDLNSSPGIVKRAYRFPDPAGSGGVKWLALPSPYSSVARSPLANDTDRRIYWTNPGETYPHWLPYASIGVSTPFDLGIVQPTVGPGVGAGGGTTLTVSRAYLYTFVNAYGEESAPSPPSAVVSAFSDATWTISGIPATATNPVGSNYPPVTTVRVYRTVTGVNTGGQFFLINSFALGTTGFVDSLADSQAIANDTILISQGWGNPPAGLDGITALPGGMLVGFTGNTVHFCEPNRPHAWPSAYDQSLEYTIVGFGVWQQSLVVLTTGFPSTGSGNSPTNYVFSQVKVPEPCIARGSIITDLMGVYYASQNGLVMLNYYGMQNQTLSAVTKNIWLNTYKADSIIACRHRAQYLAINGSDTGFLIDYSEARLGFENLSTLYGATCIWNDEYTGDAYIMGSDRKVYRWDSQNTDSMVFRWRSKQFYTPAPTNLGAFQVSLDQSVLTATPVTPPINIDNGDATLLLPNGVNAQFKLYAGSDNEDGQVLVMTRDLTEPLQIFRGPSGFKAFVWQFEVVSRVPVISVQAASTMKELKGV